MARDQEPGTRHVSLEAMTDSAVTFRPYPVAGFAVIMSRVQWSDLGQPLRLIVTVEPDE